MVLTDVLAVLAAALAALAVLPGSLGVLMLTNRIAATDWGARLIYRAAPWVLALSALPAGLAAYRWWRIGDITLWGKLGLIAFGAVLLFGFLMHTRFLFRPVKHPKFLSADAARRRFGDEEEVVGVLDQAGRPWGFIARLARRPHIVVQSRGEAPFMMSHCILAHSSIAYALDEDSRDPDLAITAAIANNLVFYEGRKGCSVIQMHNRSRRGDWRLQTLPTYSVSLGRWAALFPESPIWYRDPEWRDQFYLKLLARADVIDPASPTIVYPLQNPVDERLPMKALVLGVEAAGEAVAYPAALFPETRLVEDRLGDLPIVLFSDEAGDFVAVYERRLDGRRLSFAFDPAAGRWREQTSGSLFTVTGEAVDGPLAGRRLKPVAHYNKMFWYVWADFHPGCRIYGAKTGLRASDAA